jgi:integrator complex subunit 1
MATVIVERSSLLPALLPGTSHPAATGAASQADTYSALLSVFYHYMQLVRQQDARVAWSESQDLINVVWGSGECATLHILVVHAQIILLTYGGAERHGGDAELFSKLLLMWFPPGQELPRAYLVDTSEEALLIPDWLKLKMIRSSVPVLVDSALKDLDPQQLVLFIQSFGIPVESMSKLLQTLDQEVVEDLEAVASSVLDKVYMGQLVGVQHNRGAQGGLVFAKRLGLSLEVGGGGQRPRPVANLLPALVIPPRSTAMIPPSQVRATLLHIYDCGSPGRMTVKEKQDTFRTLQKALTGEICGGPGAPRPMLDSTVLAIQAILQSDLGAGFTTALAQRTAFSTGLFRLISVALAKPELATSATALTLLDVSRRLLQQFTAGAVSTPLTALLRTYIAAVAPDAGEKAREGGEGGGRGSVTEEEIREMAGAALRREDTAPLVARLSSLLLQDRVERSEAAAGSGPRLAQAGLLVDWLELLDPTVISSCPELQQQLVFGRSAPRPLEEGPRHSARPYLLSLLTHQASWVVLRGTVDSLLQPEDAAPDLDPGAVLDFLSACIHIPRLWQGRDQRPPVHDQPPDVLALEGGRLERLVEHVLAEAGEAGTEGRPVLLARMDLVLRCVATRPKLATVVTHLATASSAGSALATEFLTELYMRIPASLEAAGGLAQLLPAGRPLAGESVVDSVSHTLLSALSAVQQGKAWASRMQEYELAARKLVSAHPALFLRNLPLLASSLQGRTHLEFPVFRSRNHLTLFTVHLGLLELARPHLWLPSCQQSLEAALGCYIEMVQAYFPRRDAFYYTIDRLVQLLASWQAAGGAAATRAAAFLSRHAATLLRLHSAPGTCKMESLRGLAAGLAPALHARPAEEARHREDAAPRPAARALPEPLEPDLVRLLADLQAAEPDRLLPLLQELQGAANPRPAVLGHFQDELTYHLSSPQAQVRGLAYTLVLKQLKQQPGCWASVLPAYKAALGSGQEDRVEAALQHLPEFAVLAQQKVSSVSPSLPPQAGELLAYVFRLGIYSNVAATQHINAAIARLNMQAGT